MRTRFSSVLIRRRDDPREISRLEVKHARSIPSKGARSRDELEREILGRESRGMIIAAVRILLARRGSPRKPRAADAGDICDGKLARDVFLEARGTRAE